MKRAFLPLALLLLSGAAHAQGALPQETTPQGTMPKPLSASELQAMSGGANQTNIAMSSQTLSALNSGNQVNADTVLTGDVTLQSGAFNGFNGIGNFVFNTGNNNNLQGTLSVTVLAPAH
ncbi:MAG TPA: hypothetical protein VN175_14270 [Rhizomicrobium sp.]|nr:hypothetical protein [Rhizomicrobium sp.]